MKRELTIVLVVAVVAAVLLFLQWRFVWRDDDSLDQQIERRSHQYISRLEGRENLSLEAQLLLLHSYSNVEKHQRVVEMGEKLAEEIRALPAQRRKSFVEMVVAAYRQLGWEARAEKFIDKTK